MSAALNEIDVALGEVGRTWMQYIHAGSDREALENRLKNIDQDIANAFAVFIAAKQKYEALVKTGATSSVPTSAPVDVSARVKP